MCLALPLLEARGARFAAAKAAPLFALTPKPLALPFVRPGREEEEEEEVVVVVKEEEEEEVVVVEEEEVVVVEFNQRSEE